MEFELPSKMACDNFTLFYFILAYQDVLKSRGEILGCERNAGQWYVMTLVRLC